jgi:hypothetical protein
MNHVTTRPVCLWLTTLFSTKISWQQKKLTIPTKSHKQLQKKFYIRPFRTFVAMPSNISHVLSTQNIYVFITKKKTNVYNIKYIPYWKHCPWWTRSRWFVDVDRESGSSNPSALEKTTKNPFSSVGSRKGARLGWWWFPPATAAWSKSGTRGSRDGGRRRFMGGGQRQLTWQRPAAHGKPGWRRGHGGRRSWAFDPWAMDIARNARKKESLGQVLPTIWISKALMTTILPSESGKANATQNTSFLLGQCYMIIFKSRIC